VTLRILERIRLPPHQGEGGFDHAAVHAAAARLYVAHPPNDSVDVVDLASRKYVRSLTGLKGVAGVWVSEERNLLFTSNRGEDTTSIFRLPEEKELFRLPTGARPNGMAFDPGRQLLAVAGVGNPTTGAPPTVTTYDVARGKQLHQIVLPGRTRWAVFHPSTEAFYVNIADPPNIAEIPVGSTHSVRRFLEIPGVGPHGLEQAPDERTLYCACDGGQLVTVDLPSGRSQVTGTLAGPPDVLWMNVRMGHLYAAVGEPGVVQVFRTRPLADLDAFPTGADAHTLTVDPKRNEVHVFLPARHEDLVLGDG